MRLGNARLFLFALGSVLAIACYGQRGEGTYTALAGEERVDAGTCGCGDGVVGRDEECDPAAPGWEDACDAHCKRTRYHACSTHEECGDRNANCSAYTHDPDQLFCADYCDQDDDCPTLPDHRAICNFAWCAVLCDHGKCPHGMTCVEGQLTRDHDGGEKGNADICVPGRASTVGKARESREDSRAGTR